MRLNLRPKFESQKNAYLSFVFLHFWWILQSHTQFDTTALLLVNLLDHNLAVCLSQSANLDVSEIPLLLRSDSCLSVVSHSMLFLRFWLFCCEFFPILLMVSRSRSGGFSEKKGVFSELQCPASLSLPCWLQSLVSYHKAHICILLIHLTCLLSR